MFIYYLNASLLLFLLFSSLFWCFCFPPSSLSDLQRFPQPGARHHGPAGAPGQDDPEGETEELTSHHRHPGRLAHSQCGCNGRTVWIVTYPKKWPADFHRESRAINSTRKKGLKICVQMILREMLQIKQNF